MHNIPNEEENSLKKSLSLYIFISGCLFPLDPYSDHLFSEKNKLLSIFSLSWDFKTRLN